ncbi:MAG TPA: chromate transporter [Epulopiscium sp.]|nr:chromate transporter [Candidatus Epulonipiscium sp.]
MKKISLGEIFYTFLVIGTITIGGGPGGVPIIQGYIVDKKKWITQEEMLDYTTMSQSIPGAISAHIEVFIGHKLRGKRGAIVAVVGGILPAFFSIIAIAMFLRPFLENPILQNAFKGIRIGILGLIVNAAYRMGSVMNWKKSYIALAIISLSIFIFTNTSPVILFIVGAVVGLLNMRANAKEEGAE